MSIKKNSVEISQIDQNPGQEAAYKILINYLYFTFVYILHLSFASIGATQSLEHLIGLHNLHFCEHQSNVLKFVLHQ